MSDPYDIELGHTFSSPAARVWAALTEPDQFVRWYGPDGFPVDPVTVEIDARVGGRHRFVMVSEDDPSMRTGFDGSFTEVVPNNRLASSGTWHGIPGQDGGWASNLAVELSEEAGATHLWCARALTPREPPIGSGLLGDDAAQAGGAARRLTGSPRNRRPFRPPCANGQWPTRAARRPVVPGHDGPWTSMTSSKSTSSRYPRDRIRRPGAV